MAVVGYRTRERPERILREHNMELSARCGRHDARPYLSLVISGWRTEVEVRARSTLFQEEMRERLHHCHMTQRVCARCAIHTAEFRSRNSASRDAKHS
jgi:hypothetical protein